MTTAPHTRRVEETAAAPVDPPARRSSAPSLEDFAHAAATLEGVIAHTPLDVSQHLS